MLFVTQRASEDEMTVEVPDAARQLAGRLAEAFEQDQGLAKRENDAVGRLLHQLVTAAGAR